MLKYTQATDPELYGIVEGYPKLCVNLQCGASILLFTNMWLRFYSFDAEKDDKMVTKCNFFIAKRQETIYNICCISTSGVRTNL